MEDVCGFWVFIKTPLKILKRNAGIERWVNSQFPHGRGKNERVVSILYS